MNSHILPSLLYTQFGQITVSRGHEESTNLIFMWTALPFYRIRGYYRFNERKIAQNTVQICPRLPFVYNFDKKYTNVRKRSESLLE